MRRVVGLLARLSVAAQRAGAQHAHVDRGGLLVRGRLVRKERVGTARGAGGVVVSSAPPARRARAMRLLLPGAGAALPHASRAVLCWAAARLRCRAPLAVQLLVGAVPQLALELRQPEHFAQPPQLRVQRGAAVAPLEVGPRCVGLRARKRRGELRLQLLRPRHQLAAAARGGAKAGQERRGRDDVQRVVDDATEHVRAARASLQPADVALHATGG